MPIPALPNFKHRDTVVTPADQNQFVTQFENTMDTLSNNVIPAMNTSINDMNTQYNNIYNNLPFTPDSGYSQAYIDANIYKKTETYNKTEIDSITIINNLSDKLTPDDTDNFALQETGGLFKKLNWSNLKESLKSLFITKPELISIAGSATFSGTTQTINLAGIGNLGLEIGDIIKVIGTANNNKLFRVEHIKDDGSGLITDNNTIIVNYEHRGSSTPVPTKRLINETTTATITLYNKAKNAPFGQGCDWCTPASPRLNNTIYSTDLPIMVSVGNIEQYLYLEINGLMVAYVDGNTSAGGTVSPVIQKDSVYKIVGVIGNSYIFKEFR